ncbi:hypothetical protein AAMO2058_000145800 [Amorphochlora amoebiformis]
MLGVLLAVVLPCGLASRGRLADVGQLEAGSIGVQMTQKGEDYSNLSVSAEVASKWCRKESDVFVEKVPEGCPNKFVVPLAFGGLNNILERLYMTIKDVGRKRTVLLPYISNRPPRFMPRDDIPAIREHKLIAIHKVFESKSFCQAAEALGACVLCSSSPPNYPKLGEQLNNIPWPELDPKHPEDSDNATIVKHSGGVNMAPGEDYFTFVNGLQPINEIQKVINETKKKLTGDNYLAVHMRIEDDWKEFKRGQFYVEPQKIVSSITKHPFFSKLKASALRANKDVPVYIATGKKSEAEKAWENVDGIHTVMAPEITKGVNAWLAMSAVDFWLAKDARVFVGTAMWSTFSFNIARYRKGLSTCVTGRTVPHERAESVESDKQLTQDAYPTFSYHTDIIGPPGGDLCTSMCLIHLFWDPKLDTEKNDAKFHRLEKIGFNGVSMDVFVRDGELVATPEFGRLLSNE